MWSYHSVLWLVSFFALWTRKLKTAGGKKPVLVPKPQPSRYLEVRLRSSRPWLYFSSHIFHILSFPRSVRCGFPTDGRSGRRSVTYLINIVISYRNVTHVMRTTLPHLLFHWLPDRGTAGWWEQSEQQQVCCKKDPVPPNWRGWRPVGAGHCCEDHSDLDEGTSDQKVQKNCHHSAERDCYWRDRAAGWREADVWGQMRASSHWAPAASGWANLQGEQRDTCTHSLKSIHRK